MLITDEIRLGLDVDILTKSSHFHVLLPDVIAQFRVFIHLFGVLLLQGPDLLLLLFDFMLDLL